MNFIRYIRSKVSKKYIRTDLYSVLIVAVPDATLEEKINWFHTILDWLRLPVSLDKTIKNKHQFQATRIRFLLHFLEEQPELALKVSQTFQSILFQSEAFELFYSTGIEKNQGFLRELFDRSVGQIIPTYREMSSLKNLFDAIFESEEDLEALRELQSEDLQRIAKVICPIEFAQEHMSKKILNDLKRSIHLLSARAIGIIIEPDLRVRLPNQAQANKTFFILHKLADGFVNADPLEMTSSLHGVISECYHEVLGVYPVLEAAGVSVDVVYKLDALQSILNRIELLAQFYDSVKKQIGISTEVIEYTLVLAQLHLNRSSLSSFLGNSLNMIARKIVERSSISGEHYIARDSDEYREMFASGAGGGLITAFTTLIKTLTAGQSLPLFFEGFFTGFNYAASFTLIQLAHFTLATKTPAVTASTLASKLRDLSDNNKINEFITEAIALHRSAFIAVVGNLGLVIPGCIVLDYIWVSSFGHHIMNDEYSAHQLHAHNPVTSLTIFYAAITGGILWSSSILGGWIENWCVYRHQFDIFEKSIRVRKFMGSKLQRRLTRFLKNNIAGLSTNVILGYMLAFCNIVGKFFGIPLEVRHVTLSTGTLTLSVLGLNNVAEHWKQLAMAIVGVIIIGLINFIVSFTLSLFVASRARSISLSHFPRLLNIIFKRFRSKPKEFYLP